MLKPVEKVAQPHDKLIVFDDDPYFGALISATARGFGFTPTYFTSLFDMGPLARIKDYDFAIIDVFMGSIRGDELAEYIDMFFGQVPVILVSSEDMVGKNGLSRWPQSVRAFVHKAEGPYKILDAARTTLQRERLLQRLASGSGTTQLNAADRV